jgi:hypothetical protein
MNILVVLPFCKADSPRAVELLKWIKELGGCPENDLVMLEGSTQPPLTVYPEAGQFKSVYSLVTPFQLPDEKHPIGPNWMFETALKHFHKTNESRPFLWLEPDVVPMRSGWLKEIENEYARCVALKKRILACTAEFHNPKWPKIIASGTAVYPSNAWEIYKSIQTNRKVAWDIQFADKVMPMVMKSRTILSRFNRNLPPTYFRTKTEKAPPNAIYLDQISKHVALVHPDKDGSLLKLLREAPKEQFVMPQFVEHDPLMMAAPDEEWDGKPWKIQDYMATVPIIRVPKQSHWKTTRQNRIIHTVQRWRPKDPEIDRRIHEATLSWINLYMTGEVIPCHVWNPFKRDSTSIGDERQLPFLKDVLSDGLQLCHLPGDIVLLTNDDSVLHPDLANELFTRLDKQPCLCTGRLNFTDKPDFVNRTFLTRSNDIGRDAFAFRADWLKKNIEKFPDLILGEAHFDLLLGCIIRRANGVKLSLDSRMDLVEKCELPLGWVQHREHRSRWNNGPTPAQNYNHKVSAEWYRATKQPQMIDFEHA